MKLVSNIPELIAKLESVKEAVGGEGGVPPIPDFSDAMLSALNAGMGKMKFRIFNKGEDAEGVSLGGYTKQYGKKRETAGRQTGYKDLEFEGSLRRSIETAKTDNKQVVIAIVNEQTAKIAGYQEQQVGKKRGSGVAPIFTLSQSEFEQVKAEGDAAIAQVIKRLME
jgi:hypothetical protein